MANNSVHSDDLPDLIVSIYTAFGSLGQQAASVPEAEPQKPAVPIKKSITDDYLISLFDGRKFKSLKRHLRVEHKITTAEYRTMFGLPKDYPMMAPVYASSDPAWRSRSASDASPPRRLRLPRSADGRRRRIRRSRYASIRDAALGVERSSTRISPCSPPSAETRPMSATRRGQAAARHAAVARRRQADQRRPRRQAWGMRSRSCCAGSTIVGSSSRSRRWREPRRSVTSFALARCRKVAGFISNPRPYGRSTHSSVFIKGEYRNQQYYSSH